jgi:hypothetical protein
LNGFVVGRSSNQIGSPIWTPMRIILALGEVNRPDGRAIHLGSAGQSTGSGHGSEVAHDIQFVEKKTLPGRLTPGKTYILHVEGDRKFEVRRDMSFEEFTMANAGNFLVVVVKLK